MGRPDKLYYSLIIAYQIWLVCGGLVCPKKIKELFLEAAFFPAFEQNRASFSHNLFYLLKCVLRVFHIKDFVALLRALFYAGEALFCCDDGKLAHLRDFLTYFLL